MAMIAKMLKSFGRDRKGATAVIIALMIVPMIIACGAAVDFSRVASARAQLQFAVDSAASAGNGAFRTNQDGVKGYNVASTAFTSSTTVLTNYATISSVSVGVACTSSLTTCGSMPTSNGSTSHCPTNPYYCVQVSATATLKNSLLAYWIPSDVLTAVAASNTTGSPSISAGNFTHTGVGYGSDLSAIYAYAVPQDSGGNPQYGNPPPVNTHCKSSSFGPIQYEATNPAANGINTCNYLLIGENSGGSGTGSLTFQQTDPVAFTFVNFSGGTITSGTSDLDTTATNASTGATSINSGNAATQFTNEIYVSTDGGNNFTYYKTGESINGCAKNAKNCSPTPLYGNCPAHSLYGSINAYPNATNDIVPYQDSINTYSTSWEKLGYPPTHGTNHMLLPFLGPTNTQTIGGSTYTVQAVCPQWPWPANSASTVATEVFAPNSISSTTYSPVSAPTATYSNPHNDTVNVYATYFPDQAYSDGTSAAYPPPVAGCTPVTSSTTVTVASSTNPWWGWSPDNASAMDPGGSGENPGSIAVTNCTKTILNGAGTAITTTQNALQNTTSVSYNDCAFLIQPLGSNVPTSGGVPILPKYYTYTVNPTGFSTGITGNPSGIIAMTPVYSGSIPTTVTVTANGDGTYTVTEPPAYGTNGYAPEDTSHQCYNPRANGFASGTFTGDNNNNTPIDPVANPQDGAVLCDSTLPAFGLYWNDMGAWAGPPHYNDDLGYANAVTEFTCPSPASSGSSGPATLVY